MPEINIKVRDKCAEGEGVVICNNSDYTVVWDLDSEWEPYSTRTMRVNLADGTYQDVVFTGGIATLPVLTASGWVSVGLYAGDLHTSRAARLLALSSVLTPGGSPAAPAEDVYAQIMAKLNELSTVSPEDIAKAVEDYLAEHPIEETDPTVPEWAKAEITGAMVGQIAKIAAVDDNGVPTAWGTIDGYTGQVTVDNLTNPDHPTDLVQYAAFQAAVPMVQQMGIFGATVGQIIKVKAVNSDGCPTAWEPVDMPSGGGDGEWVFAGSVTAESAGMVLKVSNIHAKHILVSLYASCDDDSKRTYVIRLNDTITYLRPSALPGNGEKHLWAVEFELLTGGDENYIYCRVIPDESHYTSKSNDLVSSFSSTAVQGTMWYKVNISEFNSVAFLSGNGTTSAGNIMNVWYR